MSTKEPHGGLPKRIMSTGWHRTLNFKIFP